MKVPFILLLMVHGLTSPLKIDLEDCDLLESIFELPGNEIVYRLQVFPS